MEENKPISIDVARSRLSYAKDDDPFYKRKLIKLIERLTGRPRIEKLYTEMKQMQLTPQSIWSVALEKLKIHPVYDEKKLAGISKDGPLIIVSNHPFGVADGLMLGLIASKLRDKFGILVNEVLCTEEMFQPYFLPIDFRETKEALETIIQTRKNTLERLSQGEVIAIFPSGGVATSKQWFGPIEDLEWKRFVVKLIQKSKAKVLPIFFHGRNSRVFQIASHLHPNLRLGLLLNEVRNKMNRKVVISIGDVIEFSEIEKMKQVEDILNFLHKQTWNLANEPEKMYKHFPKT